MKKILLLLILIYILIYSIGCQPMAIGSSIILQSIEIDNMIGIGSVDNKVYGHYYIVIDNKSYEPRFLGLYQCDHINYNPYKLYTVNNLIEEKGYINLNLIIKVIYNELNII